MKHLQSIVAAALGLHPATLPAAAAAGSAQHRVAASASSSTLEGFLSWPARQLFPKETDAADDGDDIESYPLWGAPRRSANDTGVLFSFTLVGSAARRFKGRRERRSLQQDGALFDLDIESALDEAADTRKLDCFTVEDGLPKAIECPPDRLVASYPVSETAHGDSHGDSHGESTHAASGHSDAHGDGHGDGHDAAHDAHEMVVHVTYEDICEFAAFGAHALFRSSSAKSKEKESTHMM